MVWLLVFLLVVVQPVLGHYRFTRLTRRHGRIPSNAKLGLYGSVVLTQWSLVAFCAWVLAQQDLRLGDLGLGPPPGLAVLAAALVTAALAGSSILSLRAVARDPRADLPGHLHKVGRILPVNGRERAGFALVALTAGVCEEILYRGFLIFAFDRVLPGSGWSAAAAALLFGVAHAYQGIPGILTTGLLGGLLGGLYLLGGSLWPGIGLHAAVDLVNGFSLGPVAGARGLSRWPRPAVPPPAGSAPEVLPLASEEVAEALPGELPAGDDDASPAPDRASGTGL